MAAIAGGTTTVLVGTTATVAGASALTIGVSAAAIGIGTVLAFTPAFFIAPTIIAAAMVPVSTGADVPANNHAYSNAEYHDMEGTVNIISAIEADYSM